MSKIVLPSSLVCLLVIFSALGLVSVAHADPQAGTQSSNPAPGPIGIVSTNGAVCDPYNPTNCQTGLAAAYATALASTVSDVKATGSAQIGRVNCYNPNATVAYVQLFNAPHASVTLGTTAPSDVIPLQATAQGGFSIGGIGETLGGTGLSWAATTTPTGSTGVGTGLVCSISYK